MTILNQLFEELATIDATEEAVPNAVGLTLWREIEASGEATDLTEEIGRPALGLARGDSVLAVIRPVFKGEPFQLRYAKRGKSEPVRYSRRDTIVHECGIDWEAPR